MGLLSLAKIAKPGRVFKRGPVKRLHVNQHAVKAGDECCVTIQTTQGPLRCHEAQIKGPCTLKSDFSNPLPCGARIWLETHDEVEVVR